jgi:WD40 repeat protein
MDDLARRGRQEVEAARADAFRERRDRDEESRRAAALLRQTRGDLLGPFHERALRRREAGRPAEGTLWLARAFKIGMDQGDSDLQQRAGLELLAWAASLSRSDALRDAAARRLLDLPPPAPQAAQPPDRSLAALLGLPLGPHRWSDVLAFSPDSSAVLLRCGDALSLWDVRTGKRTSTPALPAGERITAAVFASDGRSPLTLSEKGTAQVWELPGFTVKKSLGRSCVQLRPDGRTVVVSDRESVRVWDVLSGRPAGPAIGHGGAAAAAFGPAGKVVVLRDGPAVFLYHLDTGRPLDPGRKYPHGTRAQFDLGETVILTYAPGTGGEVRLWDVASGQPAGPALPLKDATSFTLSPDGRTVLAQYWFKPAQLFDATTGRAIGKPLASRLGATAFSADGQLLAVAADRGVQIVDVATGEPRGPSLVHPQQVHAIAFRGDAQALVSCTGTGAWVWDVRTFRRLGLPLRHSAGHPSRALFSPDGRWVITSGASESRLWPVPTAVIDRREGVRLWVEMVTGLELGPGEPRALSPAAQRQRRQRFEQIVKLIGG